MATKTTPIYHVDAPTLMKARAYASTFASETILGDPSEFKAPTNTTLARYLRHCTVPPKHHMYHLIRKEFWSIYQDLKDGKLS